MVMSDVNTVAGSLRRHLVSSVAGQPIREETATETEMVMMSLAMPWLQSRAPGYVAIGLLPFSPLDWPLHRMIIRCASREESSSKAGCRC